MAKIGSPLQVTERKSVQEPMMLPSTSQVGNQVQALKIDYMPYDIGQANAQADSMLSGELTNMVMTVAKAYQTTQDINKQYKLNLLEKDMGDNDRLYKEKWAETRNYEDKSVVVADYRTSITDFAGRFNKIYPDATPKEQRVGMGLISKSSSKATVFENQANVAQFNETNSDLKLRLQENLKDFKTKANIDASFELDKGVSILEDMLKIKAITPNQFSAMKNAYVRESVEGRAELLAKRFGEDYSLGHTADFPTEMDIVNVLKEQMGVEVNFTPDFIAHVKDVFETSLYSKISERNKEYSARQSMNERIYAGEITEQESKLTVLMEDGKFNSAEADQAYEFYQNKGLFGRAAKVYSQLKTYDKSAPIKDIVDGWTDPDGIHMRELAKTHYDSIGENSPYPFTDDNGTIDPVELRNYLETVYTHQPSINAIVKFHREKLGRIEKDYSEGAALDTQIGSLSHDLMMESPSVQSFLLDITGEKMILSNQKFLEIRGKEGLLNALMKSSQSFQDLIFSVKQKVKADFGKKTGFFERDADGDHYWMRTTQAGKKEKDYYVLGTFEANKNLKAYLRPLFKEFSDKLFSEKKAISRRAVKEENERNREFNQAGQNSMGGNPESAEAKWRRQGKIYGWDQ